MYDETFHRIKFDRPVSWSEALAQGLRGMAQQIEQNGMSKFITAVAVIVIATVIIGAGSAGVVATYTNARLEQRVSSGFCHLNQRLDEIQRPQSVPRQCDE